MKKRITLLTAGVLCAASLLTGAFASSIIKEIRAELRPDFVIEIDGVEKEFKNAQGEVVYPVLYDGTTYLPVRAIGEMMGKTVYWYEGEKRIELRDKKTTVTDADVIIGGADQKTDIKVTEEPAKPPVTETDKTNFIGADKAKAIALAKAGFTTSDVIFEKTELDNDRGIWHYDVEFKKGLTEYDAEINAIDGKIVKWETDIDD